MFHGNIGALLPSIISLTSAVSSPQDDPIGESRSHLSAFISYARHDEVFARQLGASLAIRGVTIRADWWLQPGPDYREQLQRQILRADVFIAVLTPQSVSSEEC